MSAENNKIIQSFYNAFGQRDYASMSVAYHDNLKFSDPVFQDLDYKQTCAMWHMLCERGKDLVIKASEVETENNRGRCRWDAHYSFSATGNKVHNIIHADFQFQDGKIIRHHDHFNLWRWSRQALGATGLFLGWSPLVSNKIRKTAKNGLDKFIASHSEYQ